MTTNWSKIYSTSDNLVLQPISTPSISKPQTMLEVYRHLFNILRYFGSSNFKIVKKISPITSTSPDAYNLELYYIKHPSVGLVFSTRPFEVFKYIIMKLWLLAYLIFYLFGFIKMFYCTDVKHCASTSVLAISCYIWELLTVLAIYFGTHRKRFELCQFFGRFNAMDCIIFENGKLQK